VGTKLWQVGLLAYKARLSMLGMKCTCLAPALSLTQYIALQLVSLLLNNAIALQFWCKAIPFNCRNVQLVPANAFGSMVHCLAVVGSDLWCCTGSGTIAVFDLVTLQIRHKVSTNKICLICAAIVADPFVCAAKHCPLYCTADVAIIFNPVTTLSCYQDLAESLACNQFS